MMSEEPTESKEQPPADPKVILEQIEKKQDVAVPPAAGSPEPVAPKEAEQEPQAPNAAASAPAVEAATPLITPAMRELDDLLTKFRRSGETSTS